MACPYCGGPKKSAHARFCHACSVEFSNLLRKVYKRNVPFAKPRKTTGGPGAAGKRRRQRTLGELRANGPATTVDLARTMGMTTNGMRYHLKKLQEEGEVILMEGEYRHTWKTIEIGLD